MIEHPEKLQPGDRVALTVTRVEDPHVWVGDQRPTLIASAWLRDNADLLPEPVVAVDRLRLIAEDLFACRTTVAEAFGQRILACLPRTEPPYTDPTFHPGMLVQAEDGTGPMWLYDSDDDEDTHPFHQVKGPWYTRSELPDRLRVVYIDLDGQVRPTFADDDASLPDVGQVRCRRCLEWNRGDPWYCPKCHKETTVTPHDGGAEGDVAEWVRPVKKAGE